MRRAAHPRHARPGARAPRAAGVVLALGLASPATGPAQEILGPPRDPGPLVAGHEPAGGGPTWPRPIASALVPGTGQLLAGRERAALYLLAEIVFAARFFSERAEGSRERNRYVALAFDVARRAFDPARRDTVFEYFEQMGTFVESGPFDTDPGPDLVPPRDERTFNGRVWALARRTFFPNPDEPPDPDSPAYRRALDFYRARAVGPNFRWSWRNAGLEQDLFRQSIRLSDEALRRARQQLGLLLANHLLSAVDAFVTERVSGTDRRVEFRSALWPDDRGAVAGMLLVRVGL